MANKRISKLGIIEPFIQTYISMSEFEYLQTISFAMSQFKVRSITALERSLVTFVERMRAKENSRPFLNEVQTKLDLDPNGMFVGELDGKPIGSIGFLKYDDTFCVGSDFIIEKEYRGKGYGWEMFKTAVKSVPSHNIAGFAVDNMLDKYVERFNFKAHWAVHTIDLHMSSAVQVLSQSHPLSSLYSTKTIDEVDPAALYDYDTKVFGYPRAAFLQKFLRLTGSHARVAVDGDDNIVGYTAARVAINRDEGYRLGPLYAESSAIAKVLLKDLFEEMLEKGWSSSPSVWLQCPVGRNEEAKHLMELLDGKLATKRTYVTTKGIPKGHFDSWFAVTNSFLG